MKQNILEITFYIIIILILIIIMASLIYNIEYKVKYDDIKEELLYKLTGKNHVANNSIEQTENKVDVNNSDEDEDKEYTYSVQDIVDVCDKLYRDELLSVFYADSIVDDKIDKGIQFISNKMMQNPNIKQLAEDLVAVISHQMMNEVSNDTDEERKESVPISSLVSVAMTSFFRQETFSIWHKCICQQTTTDTIDENLLVELRNKSVDLFVNN